MSLKENTIEIYKKYGLTDYEFKAYLVFLSYPQFTVSEVAGVLDKAETSEELKTIQDIADKLEKVNFIKKIPGVVDRYVPCEPYLEMFNKESAEFRVEVTRIKDEVLADQSTRFENLEGIETAAKTSVDTTIQKQVSSIVSESDSAAAQKKETITNASTRFTETSTKLIEEIQTTTFTARDKFIETRSSFSDEIRTTTESARDRFTETGQAVEKALENELFTAGNRFETTSQKLEQDLQDILEKGRDRYESTTTALENELHQHLDDENRNLKETVNNHDSEAVNLGEQHSERFTTKNNALNSELTTLTTGHVDHTQKLESTLHQTINTLNGEIKAISEDFIKTYDEGIHREKGDMNRIADDLLKDFSDRIIQLEKELKKSLDDYTEFHRETNDQLKPTLDEILEKNILRIKKVTDDLKNTFSSLLENHTEKALEVSQNLQNDLVKSVEDRNSQLAGQVLEFKQNTLNLMENLKDTSDRYEGLSEDLAKRGSAWKALLFGKHKKFQESYVEIKQRIGEISGNMKENFANSTENYVQETGLTTASLKTDIQDVTSKYHQTVKETTSELDTKQQNSIEVQLEGLAQELTKETDDVMTTNFGKVNETTSILKDAVEHSFQTHHEEFDLHINKHRQASLDFDDQRNNFTKMTVDTWFTSLDEKDTKAKEAISAEVADQISSTNNHLQKTTDKNTAHSADFAKDMSSLQTAQRKVYDELLRLAEVDFKGCKTSVSEKIANQVKLFSDETTSMVKLEREQLDEQIRLVNTEFEGKNQFQIMRINEQIELFKSEVAAINEKQQKEINDHIQQFQQIVATLDSKQHTLLEDQIKLFSSETGSMETSLQTLLEKHKSDYKENTATMQKELVKTVETTIQDTKDAIADFTLTFMNSIDEVFEMADANEVALTDISNAAMRIEPLGSSTTWHVFGTVSLLESIISSMGKTKSTITIITPTVEPKILEALSQMAYVKKSVRFLYTTSWDMSVYAAIVEKMKVLGNIQFRNLKTTNDFYAVSRDAEEIILCPQSKKKEDMIAIISEQEGYAALFMAFIYPIFQANSRPI